MKMGDNKEHKKTAVGHVTTNGVASSTQPTAASQHSTSVGSTGLTPDAALRASPTLGTIVSSAGQLKGSAHQSAMSSLHNQTQPGAASPAFGPAPRPFAPGSTTSISTATTPLTLTPSGTATPIKMSMSSLTAAANSSSGVSHFFTSSAFDSPMIASEPQQPQQQQSQQKHAIGNQSPRQVDGANTRQEVADSTVKSPAELASKKIRQHSSALGARKSNKTIVVARPARAVQQPAKGWSYYLFVAITILAVLLVLIVAVLILKSNKLKGPETAAGTGGGGNIANGTATTTTIRTPPAS